MFNQMTTFLLNAAAPRPPAAGPDLRAQALDLLESPGRLRGEWAEVMRRLEDEWFEAGEFAMLCRVHLNLIDNYFIFLKVLGKLTDHLKLPPEKLRSAAAEVHAHQDEVRPLYELATRKAPPLDPAKLAAAREKHAGEPAVEVGELIRQVQAGEVNL